MKYRRAGTTFHLRESKMQTILRKAVLLWRKIKHSRWEVRLAMIAGTALVVAGIFLLVFSKDVFQTASMQGQPTPTISGPQTNNGDSTNNNPTEPPVPTPTPVQKGVDGEDIKTLQQRLMDLGYMDSDDPTTHFGPVTEAALKYFQRQAGIPQDGILGDETKTLLFSDAAKPYTLLQGAAGDDVESFQKRLQELGFLKKADIDSVYGPKTIQAVKDFQKMNKLGADGKAGEQTFDRIFSSKAVGPVTLQIKLSKNINKFIQIANGEIGDPYVSGREGPNAYDCSGLVCYCLRTAGISIGRYTAYGYSGVDQWKKIDKFSDLKKGDLLFFHIDSRKVIGHTGIYIGGGMMIDASSSNGHVVKRHCDTAYWRAHFRLARRPWSI